MVLLQWQQFQKEVAARMNVANQTWTEYCSSLLQLCNNNWGVEEIRNDVTKVAYAIAVAAAGTGEQLQFLDKISEGNCSFEALKNNGGLLSDIFL